MSSELKSIQRLPKEDVLLHTRISNLEAIEKMLISIEDLASEIEYIEHAAPIDWVVLSTLIADIGKRLNWAYAQQARLTSARRGSR